MERLRSNVSDEELENWNTKRTEKLSKITAKKETYVEIKVGSIESSKNATVLQQTI